MAGDEPSSPEEGSFLDVWGTLIVVTIVMFVVSLDGAMVPVAIEPITRDLGTSASGVQAALSVYSILNAPLLLTGAALGVLYGNKRVYRVGIVLFAAGTLLGAFSQSIGVFVLGWSVVKGLADTMVTPISLALLLGTYTGERRATAFGIWGAVTASAQAIGPILMGFIATVASWRWAIGLESAVLVVPFLLLFLIPDAESSEPDDFDVGGTVLSVVGLGSVILGFLLAGRFGWVTPRRPLVVAGVEIAPFGFSVVPFVFAIGLVGLWALVTWERRRIAENRMALFTPSLFGNRVFVTGLAIYGIYNVVTTGFGFVLPTFLAIAAGFNPLQIGIAFLPFAVTTVLLSLSSSTVERWLSSKRLVQLSIGLFVLGLVLLAGALTAEVSIATLVVPLAVFGAGAGLMRGPTSNLSLSATGGEQGGEASGILETGKEFGRGMGNAAIGSLFLSALYGGIVDGLLRVQGISVPGAVRERLAVQLEDAAQSLDIPSGQPGFGQFSPAEVRILDVLVKTAAENAVDFVVIVVVLLVLAQLVLSALLPATAEESSADEGSD